MSEKVQRKCTQEGVFFVACIASKASVNSNKSIYVHDGARVSNRLRYLQRLRIRPGIVNSPSLHPPSKVLRSNKDSSTKLPQVRTEQGAGHPHLVTTVNLILPNICHGSLERLGHGSPVQSSSVSTGECTSKSKCQRKKKKIKNC